MNLVLCDDNPQFLETLSRAVELHCALRDRSCRIRTISSPASLLEADLRDVQAVLLDIDMPQITGLEAARVLRARYPELLLVFVTGFIEYAPAGYCVDAFRYLLKQGLDRELPACLDALWERLYVRQESIRLSTREEELTLPLKDILYFEGTAQRHVICRRAAGDALECHGKLSALEAELAEKGFLRIQKSFLVNMAHIRSIKSYQALLTSGETLKVSERSNAQVCKTFLLWKGRQL